MKSKDAIVLGATGLVGSKLLNLLLESGYYSSVVSLTRKYLDFKHDRLVQYVVDDYDRMDEAGELIAASDIYCCLGTTMKTAGSKEAFRKVDFDYPLELARLASENGCEQFFLISALGANPKSNVFYSRVKGEIEAAISELEFDSTHIFRPSLLLGNRSERRIGERAAIIASKYLSFGLVGPLKKYKPLEAETVAQSMFQVAQKGLKGLNIFESEDISSFKHN